MCTKEPVMFGHLRVRTSPTTIHSEMIENIQYNYEPRYDYFQKKYIQTPVNVKSVFTSNPWGGNGSTLLSQTQINPDAIVRWDVFRAMKTHKYYYRKYEEQKRK